MVLPWAAMAVEVRAFPWSVEAVSCLIPFALPGQGGLSSATTAYRRQPLPT